MSFYWLQPEWKLALCPSCGANIWDSGGDPDWGLCYDCFSIQQERQQGYSRPPKCDICGEHVAVADANGYAVCSEACYHKATDRQCAEMRLSQ